MASVDFIFSIIWKYMAVATAPANSGNSAALHHGMRNKSRTRNSEPFSCSHLLPAASPRSFAVYTESMGQRLVALLVVLVMGLQGPVLAYASGSAAPTAAHCCPGTDTGHSGNGCSSCPDTVAAGACCAGSAFFATMTDVPTSLTVAPPSLLLTQAGSVSFATECPSPQFRPPIV